MLIGILEGRYNGELNRDNPLGMQGDLAEAYGALIRELWSGYHSHLTPRKFKVRGRWQNLGICIYSTWGYLVHHITLQFHVYWISTT